MGGKDLILHTIGRIGVDGARYCAMEFGGEAVAQLSMDGRMTMTNMAIEAGGKCGYMEPDQKTLEYLKGRVKREFELYYSDEDARYEKIYRFEVSDLEPQVAFPPSPDNVHPVREAAGIQLDQVVIGSCTNGRLEDLQVAAALLKGRQVHPRVRLLVIPATQQIYREALKQGLLEIFVEAGAAVCTPTCGPCLGGHMGILARGEKALATTNRNFVGRMGHPESEVYLCGPAVAAASAVAGTIVDPREVLDWMILEGRVHLFGHNVDTDAIIPARYLSAVTAEELAPFCMTDIRPGFADAVQQGDIIVAGKNFGCGSSREHAPLAIKGTGDRLRGGPQLCPHLLPQRH